MNEILNEVPLWELAEITNEQIRSLQDAGGVSRPLALVLACRGVAPDKVGHFLRPTLQHLIDPYSLPGAKEAAERMWDAVAKGEQILIHGDYDTDGITAAVLLAWCLRQNGGRVECFLPHRIDDGYGLTPDSVDKACLAQAFTLLITVDCGINSFEAIKHARDRGMDVIVTDHHEPGPEMPCANVILNPKLPGGPPELRDLAGVGVSFKLCHAFLKYGRETGLGGMTTDLKSVLDLVALGTVADIVPLLQENRCLVRHGLKVLSGQQRPGVRALCEISGLGEVEAIRASDITFKLAPRINAAGRLGDPMESMRLLDARGMNDAMPLAMGLDDKNRERQQLEEKTLRQAEAFIAERVRLDECRSIAVWNAEWPQGVIGIVASRLARRFHRPCVVLTMDASGQWRGSTRSVRRVNIVVALERCQAHIVRFGGHPMAAGLSVETDQLEAFEAAFEAAVRQVLEESGMRPSVEICGELRLDEIDETAVNELAELEPFGHSNPEPMFLTRFVQPDRIMLAGRQHSRGLLSDGGRTRLPFIYFGKIPAVLPPPPWDIVYTPRFNTHNGARTLQLQLHDVRSVTV